MKYVIFAFLIFATNMNAMNNETIEQKRFKEYLKNACGVTDIKIFFRNGDNDGNYPFCWAAIKAFQQNQEKMNYKS